MLQFRSGQERGGFDVEVRELEPVKRVVWQVVGGPEEWIGTQISFSLKQLEDFTTAA